MGTQVSWLRQAVATRVFWMGLIAIQAGLVMGFFDGNWALAATEIVGGLAAVTGSPLLAKLAEALRNRREEAQWLLNARKTAFTAAQLGQPAELRNVPEHLVAKVIEHIQGSGVGCQVSGVTPTGLVKTLRFSKPC